MKTIKTNTNNYFSMRTRSRSLLTGILLVCGAGCQTSPLADPMRHPAQIDPPDSNTSALIERDGLEAIGIVAQGALLDHKLERYRLKGSLVKASDRGFNPDVSSVTAAIAGINLAASGINALVFSSLTSDPHGDSYESSSAKQTQFITKLFRGNNSLAIVAYGVSAGAMSYSLVMTPIAAFDKFDNHTGEQNIIAPLQTVIRRKSYKTWREARADHENMTLTFVDPKDPNSLVKNQAAFDASLKLLAKDISDRTALLLHLEESEQTSLRVHIEGRLRDSFGTDKAFVAGEDFKLDVRKLLRGIVADVDERQAAVEQLVRATKTVPTPLAADEVRKALENLITQMTDVNKSALVKYEELTRNSDPILKAMAAEYYGFSREIESFRRKVKTQLALLPPAPVVAPKK